MDGWLPTLDRQPLQIVFILSVTMQISLSFHYRQKTVTGAPICDLQFPPHGGVASDRQECSDIGAQLLRDGGSAVDAAVGCMLCLGVVQPRRAGFGRCVNVALSNAGIIDK